jgi:septum formation protein
LPLIHGEPLVLASGSPRRHALLREAGIPFLSFPVATPEHPERVLPGIDARAPGAAGAARVTVALALEKALVAAALRAPPSWVLAADTVVVAPDGALLGKPRDRADAARMMGLLDGRAHAVVTGVALVHAGRGRCACLSETSRVSVGPLGRDELAQYLASELWRGKAGGYGAQDPDGVVRSIEGSVTNVIGLPMERLSRALEEAGVTRCIT